MPSFFKQATSVLFKHGKTTSTSSTADNALEQIRIKYSTRYNFKKDLTDKGDVQGIPGHKNQSGKDYFSEVIRNLKKKGDSDVLNNLQEKGNDVWSKASNRLIEQCELTMPDLEAIADAPRKTLTSPREQSGQNSRSRNCNPHG